ncbi:MAG TPA: hypothetical protein VHT27_12115 [Solirubrobacteraceae bacterium]|jgi:hypothetical protein|nr:hypothetical protein [Solirubrobacteraceae bacterium]
MNAFVCAGAGFLLAVLWFDLMFDVQLLGGEPDVSSIAAYYARVTTAARPMNRLVAAAMLCTIAAVIVELARATPAAWIGWSSLALAGSAVGLAGARTVPAAVRLGASLDPPAAQLALARAILQQHVYCFAAIAGVLVLQLGFG